jgi:two-component system NtrC family sensor kinase
MDAFSQSAERSVGLEQFTASDAEACGRVLRSLGEAGTSRQGVAERIVGYFYDNFVSAETGERSCVLVRCFQTSSYASLPLDYQDAADRLLASMKTSRRIRCLALLATRGDKTTWNDVATSTAHQAIPLPSVEVVRRAPMIARLLEAFNVPLDQVVAPAGDLILPGERQSFDVFHVPDAVDSPFIPAQEGFVRAFGVKSVLGMGGVMADGELFAVILFTRVAISREVAEHFRTLAADVKEALSPFAANKVFGGNGRHW